jgi:hypothetical protein
MALLTAGVGLFSCRKVAVSSECAGIVDEFPIPLKCAEVVDEVHVSFEVSVPLECAENTLSIAAMFGHGTDPTDQNPNPNNCPAQDPCDHNCNNDPYQTRPEPCGFTQDFALASCLAAPAAALASSLAAPAASADPIQTQTQLRTRAAAYDQKIQLFDNDVPGRSSCPRNPQRC